MQQLTQAQAQRVETLIDVFEDRVSDAVRVGYGDRTIDPDLLVIDLLLVEQDPVVAEQLRERLGVGVA